jgi:hypothetical protein
MVFELSKTSIDVRTAAPVIVPLELPLEAELDETD